MENAVERRTKCSCNRRPNEKISRPKERRLRIVVSPLLELVVAAQQHSLLVVVLGYGGDALIGDAAPLGRRHRHVLRVVRVEARDPHAPLALGAASYRATYIDVWIGFHPLVVVFYFQIRDADVLNGPESLLCCWR